MDFRIIIRPTRQLGPLAWLGLAAGAGAMFIFDPTSGRRRRALVRDEATHLALTGRQMARKTAVDVAHRVQGLAAATISRLKDEPVTDDVLAERVRSRMGMVVSHPHSITVSCRDGEVTLAGPIIEREAKRFVRTARNVHGVRAVKDQLERHSSQDIPALQGGEHRVRRPEPFQQNWAPAMRLTGAVLGGASALGGLRLGGLPGGIALALGSLLAARSLTNLSTRRLLGIGAGRRAIDLEKHIQIHAPVKQVFEFCKDFENLPQFMSHLHSVRAHDGRSHWVAKGPAGVAVSWESELTELVENQLIAWQSVPHSVVQSAGSVRFESDGAGGTHLHVKMTYNPPAGALGHVIASMFGVDPKHAMNDDLLRLKSLLETGRATAHGHQVSRDQLHPEAWYPVI